MFRLDSQCGCWLVYIKSLSLLFLYYFIILVFWCMQLRVFSISTEIILLLLNYGNVFLDSNCEIV